MDEERVATYLADKQSGFCMNVPAVGIWEQQIRTVRCVLDSVLAHSAG